MSCLGIIDWGIGGFGLVAALQARGCRPAIAYLSDAGFTPYGRVPPQRLAARLEGLVGWLAEGGCDQVVVACNAASTVVPEVAATIPVHGIIEAGVEAALAGPGTIGVVGGVRTIEAGLHRAALEAAGRQVRAVVAQPWSALIEAGQLEGHPVEEAVATVLRALGPVDRLLLACTHYPALAPLLRRQLPDTVLVDPIEGVIEALSLDLLPPGELVVSTTGDPAATARSARAAWGLEIGAVATLAR